MLLVIRLLYGMVVLFCDKDAGNRNNIMNGREGSRHYYFCGRFPSFFVVSLLFSTLTNIMVGVTSTSTKMKVSFGPPSCSQFTVNDPPSFRSFRWCTQEKP